MERALTTACAVWAMPFGIAGQNHLEGKATHMKKAATLGLSVTLLASTVFAQEGSVPKGVPHLDHVFIIMMENHGYNQVVNNPNDPFVDKYAKSVNSAANYFAVAHPSLTNYLEVVGGSNFGVHTDNSPDWHNANCTTNLASGIVATDNPASPNICPIYGTGTDAATPALDVTNETTGLPGDININGTLSIPANPKTVGKTLADQLVAAGLTWKSYQESLPPSGADNVNNADGYFSNLTDLTQALPGEAQTQSNVVALYAVKHNPFAYFRSVQEGEEPNNSLKNMVDFEGTHGLFADLSSGQVPTFSFIAPNQCNDQHGRGNAGPSCEFDPSDDGTQNGLNPGLLYRGDVTVQLLVTAIHKSPVWKDGRNAIILVWDEDDYSVAPTTNQVLLTVDTNYGVRGVQSNNFYTHFSLLKSVESGLGLPCLNHACDASTNVMSDLFDGEQSQGDRDHDDGDQ
jgi:phosphatidylinositol-3-phosphatase